MKKNIIILGILFILGILLYQFSFKINNVNLDCKANIKYLSDSEIKKELDLLGYNNLKITQNEVIQKGVIGIQYNIEIKNNSNKKISFFGVEQVLPANVVKETIYNSDKSFGLDLESGQNHTTLQYLFINKTEWFSRKGMLDSIVLLYSYKSKYNPERLYKTCEVKK